MHATRVHQAMTDATLIEATPDGPVARDPARVVADLNQRFRFDRDAPVSGAISYGIVDAAQATLALCVAGNPLPLVRRASGTVETLAGPGFPVGLLSDARYETHTVPFQPGDVVLLHSDGLSDRVDGPDGLLRVVASTAVPPGASPGRAVADGLATIAGTGPEPLSDDLSALVVELDAGGAPEDAQR